jgi:hypothetical protein
VSGPAELVRAEPALRPTYVSADLRSGLLEPHPPVQDGDGGWRCGGWTVTAQGTDVTVDGSGDRVDGLRALCVAWWRAGAELADANPDPALEALGW